MSQYLGLTTSDMANIVCRVLEQKVNDFIKFLKYERPFGYVISFLYTIEFQKSGLSLCYTLLWVDSSNKIRDAIQINEYISAEIHDPVEDPRGYKVVTELMMHGPCGVANLGTTCTKNGACNKHFSKKYNKKTFFDNNGHTHYRRRQTEFHIMKGESSLEPAMQILNMHLENMKRVNFRERDRLEIIINMPNKKKTTLTEWYVYNNENTDGRHLTYLDFPSEFVWYPNSKSWHQRQVRTKKSLGLSELIDFIYNDTTLKPSTAGALHEKAIVCPKNDTTNVVDANILSSIEGETKTYLSKDEAIPMGRETSEIEMLS
ncbi:DNA helicase [Tanacetum coccineum]